MKTGSELVLQPLRRKRNWLWQKLREMMTTQPRKHYCEQCTKEYVERRCGIRDVDDSWRNMEVALHRELMKTGSLWSTFHWQQQSTAPVAKHPISYSILTTALAVTANWFPTFNHGCGVRVQVLAGSRVVYSFQGRIQLWPHITRWLYI